MDAIILAAGISKRLRPLTDTKPKSLLEVEGKTLIERNIEALQAAGISSITIVVGYLKDQIIDKLHGLYSNIEFVENSVYDTSGSGYSLFLGLISLKNRSKEIIFQDADILIHPRIINDVKSLPGQSFLYLSNTECDAEAVKVVIDKNGYVTQLSKEINSNASSAGESIGIVKLSYKETKTVLSWIQQKIDLGTIDFEWEEIIHFHGSSLTLSTKGTTLPWIEIDFPEDLVKARQVAALINEI